jgi:hypothetical protein
MRTFGVLPFDSDQDALHFPKLLAMSVSDEKTRVFSSPLPVIDQVKRFESRPEDQAGEPPAVFALPDSLVFYSKLLG